MQTTFLLWVCVVFTAALNGSVAMAMGKKPPVDDPVKSKTIMVNVDVLYRNQQCSVLQAQTRWIDSPEAYQTLFAELRKTYIGGQAQQPPPVDLSKEGVLLVAMGQKNTGGYSVDLANQEAVIDGGVLQVAVQWREPKKGMMVTQALTSPCLLLKIPNAEFDRIEIKDQSGAIRLSASR
jgi:hypothetical protein